MSLLEIKRAIDYHEQEPLLNNITCRTGRGKGEGRGSEGRGRGLRFFVSFHFLLPLPLAAVGLNILCYN